MVKMTYSDKLKDPRWQKKRLEILNRDEWACTKCYAIDRTLHVHHLKYSKSGNPWDSPMNDLTTLCDRCHKVISNNDLTPDEFKKVKVVGYWEDDKCDGAFYSIKGTFFLVRNDGDVFSTHSVALMKEIRGLINHVIRHHG